MKQLKKIQILSFLFLGVIYSTSLSALPANIVESAIWIAWSIGVYVQTSKHVDINNKKIKNNDNKNIIIPVIEKDEPKEENNKNKNLEEDNFKKSDKKSEERADQFLRTIKNDYNQERLSQLRHSCLDNMFAIYEDDCL